MITINFDASALVNLTQVLGKADDKLLKGIDTAIYLGANYIRTVAVLKINRGARSGKLYKRTKTGRYHQASDAGEPPKTDYGALVASLRVDRFFLKSEAGSDKIYAAMLEEGTRYMLPHPWLAPSLNESQKQIEKYLLSALKKSFKK